MKKSLLSISFVALIANLSYGQCSTSIISPPNHGQDCCNAWEATPQGGTCGAYDLNQMQWPAADGMGGQAAASCWGADMTNITWATVTPTSSGSYTIDVLTYAGGAKDVALAVYTGSCGSLTQVGCNDAGVSSGLNASVITMSMTAGTTYYIAVATVEGQETKTIGFCLTGGTNPPAPANDFCVNATSLSTNTTFEGTLVNATSTTTFPDFDEVLCSGSTENNVWYTVTTTTAGSYYLIIDNANCANLSGFQVSFYNAALNTCALIDAAGTGTGNCINYANTGDDSNFQVTLTLAASTTYYFTVDGQSGTECTFDILFSTVPITSLNNDALSLSAKEVEEGILVQWHNISETNNTLYTLEKSTDGASFNSIKTVQGNGTTEDAALYSHIDSKPLDGAYYRVKEVSGNGIETYSNIAFIGDIVNHLENTISTFPNPAKDIITFGFTSDERGKDHTLAVYNTFGQLIYTSTLSSNIGTNAVTLSTDKFETGSYIVVLSDENGMIAKDSFFVNK